MNIKERNPIVQLVIMLVTCNLYNFYWGFVAAKEAVSVKDTEDTAMLEAILTMIPVSSFVGIYLTEKKFAEGCAAKGIEHKDNAILYAILNFFGLQCVTAYLFQKELNKLATE